MFTALKGRTYDVIVSNPPYVNAESVAELPQEYQAEPSLALGSGEDGLDASRQILAEAKSHLNPGGLLPWGTLAANLIGGYFIGVCVAAFQAMPELDPVWRLALITGFLGALTTFSSFSAEVVLMLQAERYGLALGTAVLHLVGSLVLTVLGMKSVVLMMAR